jgi:hypothetical protein
LYRDGSAAADRLPLEEQTVLIEVLSRRLNERRRDELAREIQQARQEFAAGLRSVTTPADLMRRI